MLTFIRGNDKGNAVLMALILIIILSTLFLSFVPRIFALDNFAREYRTQVINDIESKNMEIRMRYDL